MPLRLCCYATIICRYLPYRHTPTILPERHTITYAFHTLFHAAVAAAINAAPCASEYTILRLPCCIRHDSTAYTDHHTIRFIIFAMLLYYFAAIAIICYATRGVIYDFGMRHAMIYDAERFYICARIDRWRHYVRDDSVYAAICFYVIIYAMNH